MRIIEYTPDHFDALQGLARSLPEDTTLRHRGFVDWYYASSEFCKLQLCVNDDGRVIGTVGLERLRFTNGRRTFIVGNASNFNAVVSGAGGYLFVHWLKNCDVAIAFGGSEHTLRIVRSQRWIQATDVRLYRYGRPTRVNPGDPRWKRTAKRVLASLPSLRTTRDRLRALPAAWRGGLSVREEVAFSPDMFPGSSAFSLRFSPPLAHLRWRYALDLPFLEYRLFRILRDGRSVGYVIIGIGKDQMFVSQSDAEHPRDLACAVAQALAELETAGLVCAPVLAAVGHPVVAEVYERLGFRLAPEQRPLWLGPPAQALRLCADTAASAISFDWGDNGLRRPFRNEGAPTTLTSLRGASRTKGFGV